MRYIDDFLSKIKESLGLDNILLEVAGDDFVKNEVMIIEKLKKSNQGRFRGYPTPDYCGVSLKANKRWLFTTTISEYPSCCGKAIMHSICINNTIIKKEGDMYSTLTEEQAKDLFTGASGIVGVIARMLRYGSLDFVISENEQLYLFRATNLAPKETFINPRLINNPHTLHSYSMDLNKFGEIV